jgi:hypothetical protein
MKYKILRDGRGPINGHRKNEEVAKGLSWQEAYDKVFALKDLCGGSWDFWLKEDK